MTASWFPCTSLACYLYFENGERIHNDNILFFFLMPSNLFYRLFISACLLWGLYPDLASSGMTVLRWSSLCKISNQDTNHKAHCTNSWKQCSFIFSLFSNLQTAFSGIYHHSSYIYSVFNIYYFFSIECLPLKFYEIKLQSFSHCHYANSYAFIHLFMAHESFINNRDIISYLNVKSTY